MIDQVLIQIFGFYEVFLTQGIYLTVMADHLLPLSMTWYCIGYLQIFFCLLLKRWYWICCPCWWVRSSMYCHWNVCFFPFFPTAYFTPLCCILHGEWCHWALQCSATWCHISLEVYWQCGLQFFPLTLDSVLVFCTFQKVFFAEISICFSDRDICCICWPDLVIPWYSFC